MERAPFLKRHNILIKCAVVSLAAHVTSLFVFQVAVIRQKNVPPHLQFTLLSLPELWDNAGPVAEATNDLGRADTSLLALFESTAASTHPKLELLHKQLIWEQEPESMAVSPFSSGFQDWTLEKEKVDYAHLLDFLNDYPPFIESPVVGEPVGSTQDRHQSLRKDSEVVMSPSLAEREVVHQELPQSPESEIASSQIQSTRLCVGIDSSGAVRHALVLHSSGDPASDMAARKAVSKWKFAPAAGTDTPSLVWGWVDLSFMRPTMEPELAPQPDASAVNKNGN